MNRPGKYDAIVAEALRLGKPVARVMRGAGFNAQAIRSCHGMLAQIKKRVSPEDEAEWNYRKRRMLLAKRTQAIERLEKDVRQGEFRDLQLLETCDRLLAQMKKKGAPADDPGPPRVEPDLCVLTP